MTNQAKSHNKKIYDVLIVANQNASIQQIKLLLRSTKSSFLLTTHKLYESEKSQLNYPNLQIRTFADFLSDSEMWEIDDEAQKNAEAMQEEDFVSCFMRLSILKKNALVKEKLFSKYSFSSIFYFDTLGIAGDFWKGIGGKRKMGEWECIPEKTNKFLNTVSHSINFIKTTFRLRETVIFRTGEEYFIFFDDTARLTLNKEKFWKCLRISWFSLFLKLLRLKNYKRLLTLYLKKYFNIRDIKECTTIHNYPKITKNFSDAPIYVFQEGYLPSNYHGAILKGYSLASCFISDSPFAQKWFRKNNKPVRNLPEILFSSPFIKTSKTSRAQHILLALNHAGDWSALINRSDTDTLVAAFFSLAKYFPQSHFMLRLHPTMTHPAHEGIHSAQRIERAVADLGLTNLTISKNSLENDMQWTHLLLGEYSNVLIKGYQTGIPTLIVNLTKRRNFMQDFVDFGFFEVHSYEQLIAFFKNFETSYELLTQQNDIAIEKYNIYKSYQQNFQDKFHDRTTSEPAKIIEDI